MKADPILCSCDSGAPVGRLSRRQFLRTTAAGLATASVVGPDSVMAAPTAASPSETLTATLYKSLTEEQRAALCFDFGHDLRSKVDNNWHITEKRIGAFLNADQQAMVKEIFLKLHSPEYAEIVYNQVVHDSEEAGFGDCSVAFFGQPGTGNSSSC